MKKNYPLLFFTVLFLTANVSAQKLQPGFDKSEYIELLKLSARTTASLPIIIR
jgi:hypothetical protein